LLSVELFIFFHKTNLALGQSLGASPK